MKSKTKKHIIFGCKGCGSAIAEAFFELAGIKFDRIEVNYEEESDTRDELISYNPLCQVPTIVMPNREVITETLAIAHYVHAIAPKAKLIPKSKKDLPKFLRWSTYLIAAVYPTFTYGDDPSKWVSPESAAKSLRESTDDHRKELWLTIEKNASQPYFMGQEMSAIDIYICVMNRWRPRTDWFKANCPKLAKIALKVEKNPKLKHTWAVNFSA